MMGAAAEAALYHDASASDGYFAIVTTQTHHQNLYPMSALPAILGAPAPPDMTVSQAEYRRQYNRKKANVLRVGLCFVDCDLHKSRYAGLEPEQVAQMLLFHCDDTGLPKPSIIVFSGRGIHVKWMFNAPIPAAALTRWGFVQKEFGKRLTDFGADMGALDITRCLRVVGTLNVKSGERARVLYQHSRRYDFDELANLLLPYTREQVAAWRQTMEEKQARRALREVTTGTVCAGSNLWTIPDLYCRRLDDIRALCALRGWHNGIPDGERGKVLYVATICHQWAHGPTNLESEAQELARQLCPSLTPSDVRGCVCSVVAKSKTDKPFTLRTQTIIEALSITTDEQKKLKTLCNSTLRKERKREADRLRNRKFTDRETYKSEAQGRRERARTLRAQGMKYAAIGAEMGLTAKQVDNLLNR